MSIEEAILAIKAKCEQQPPSSETATCQRVILKLLKEAGYDIEDEDDVWPVATNDAGKRPDYTLLRGSTDHTFFIEVKEWKHELNDDNAHQALGYPHSAGKRWCVRTNGKRWLFYDNHILNKKPPDKLLAGADMDHPDELALFLTAIGKDSVMADKLKDYAAEALAAQERHRREHAEAERKRELRTALDEVWSVEIKTPDSQLIKAIHAVLCQHENLKNLTPEDLLERLFSTEESGPLADPCDLQMERGPPPHAVEEIMKRALNKIGLFEFLSNDENWIAFLPTSLLKILPRDGESQRWLGIKEPIPLTAVIWLGPNKETKKKELWCFLRCFLMKDMGRRNRLISLLIEKGFYFPKGDRAIKLKWPTFYCSKTYYDYIGEDALDVDPSDSYGLERVVAKALDANLQAFEKLERVCREVFRPQ